MANKTQATAASVDAFLAAVPDDARRSDAQALAAIMTEVTGVAPAIWGGAIVGFGQYHYRYDSGREGDMCRLGFSPRAKELVLYVLHETPEEAALLARLGKHRTGKSCLYIKRLSDVDEGTLREVLAASWAEMALRYPE